MSIGILNIVLRSLLIFRAFSWNYLHHTDNLCRKICIFGIIFLSFTNICLQPPHIWYLELSPGLLTYITQLISVRTILFKGWWSNGCIDLLEGVKIQYAGFVNHHLVTFIKISQSYLFNREENNKKESVRNPLSSQIWIPQYPE